MSAISNAAAFHYQAEGYFIWGVEDKTHRIVGTTFSQYCNYNSEPYQNYLARNLSPSMNYHPHAGASYPMEVVLCLTS